MSSSDRTRVGQSTIQPPFLPDMCSLQSVFLLVILGELLALALTLASAGLVHFDWEQLGLRSFLIQWVVLLSAALLCPIRFWLGTQKPQVAGLMSYSLVLAVTALCTQVGLRLTGLDALGGEHLLSSNLLLSAIFGGVVLRYLYVQQQWSNQQKAELQARIQALQSRIQPHFLFNSMNSIASLIGSDPDLAERLVEDLCSLFRASLAEPAVVALASELSLCRQYLDIESVRLGERLSVEWEIAEQVEQQLSTLRVPSLLIQPLLENAIQHGVQPRIEGGTVKIALKFEDASQKKLSITVVNPLPLGNVDNLSRRTGNRMALENIEHRLKAYYGLEARLNTGVQGVEFLANIICPQELEG